MQSGEEQGGLECVAEPSKKHQPHDQGPFHMGGGLGPEFDGGQQERRDRKASCQQRQWLGADPVRELCDHRKRPEGHGGKRGKGDALQLCACFGWGLQTAPTASIPAAARAHSPTVAGTRPAGALRLVST